MLVDIMITHGRERGEGEEEGTGRQGKGKERRGGVQEERREVRTERERGRCHFCHILFVEAVTEPPSFKGLEYRHFLRKKK